MNSIFSLSLIGLEPCAMVPVFERLDRMFVEGNRTAHWSRFHVN
jgi:hypothetical protein